MHDELVVIGTKGRDCERREHVDERGKRQNKYYNSNSFTKK